MFGQIEDLSVEAPSFDDPMKQMILAVDGSWVKQNAGYHRIQPLFDFWTLVKGVPPPVNLIGHHENYKLPELLGLKAAHALFSGLERPLDESHNGDGIYVFLTLPKVLYRHVADMACLAKLRDAPKNAVFACYVRRYEEETAEGISGRVLAWEWVKSDPNEPTLPQDYQERYQKLTWRTV